MARNLHANTVAELRKSLVQPVAFVEAEFASSVENIWSGVGDISWDGKTWLGMGKFGGISPMGETTGVNAQGIELTLSGIPNQYITYALDETRRNKPLKVWIGFFDSAGAIIANPYKQFSGRIDASRIQMDGETSTIVIQAEQALVDLNRNREVRYTDAAQQARMKGDTGFKYVASIQETNLVWGRGTIPAVLGGGGGGSDDRGPRQF